MEAGTMKQASEKQEALISKLRVERISTESVEKVDEQIAMMGRMTTALASSLITALLAAPHAHRSAIEVGSTVRTPKFGTGTVLAIDGDIVTVKCSAGVKKMYAGMLK